MNYFKFGCLIVLGLLAFSGSSDAQNKKSFTFSVNPDVEKAGPENTTAQVEEESVLKKIEKNNEQTAKENAEIKDMVSSISESVKEKSNLNKLPVDQFSSDEEEEARENSKFLTDEMEESAENFAESNETEDNADKGSPDSHIKRYQAEVISAMTHQGIYHKMEGGDMESISQTFEDSEETCLPDFSVPCPDQFFFTSSGCVPTRSYKGPCNKIQDKLMLLQDHQKLSWGEVCATQWACLPDRCPNGTDYISVCPVGWSDVGKGTCRSDRADQKCGSELNFAHLTKTEKQQLEQECGFRWKCKAVKYVFNFESQCPMNWTQLGKYQCEAPKDYDGNCPKISNLKKYQTEEMKKQIEIACLVNWPYQIKVMESQRNYSQICPIGWVLLSNGMCRAPENYPAGENCKDVVAFGSMDASQKMSYSSACQVDFPFIDKSECARDYSFECPLGWVPTSRSGFCKAPANYKSKICNHLINFNNLTDRHKKYYVQFCNIDWACEGEIENSMAYASTRVNYEKGSMRKRISGAVDSITGLII